MIQKYLLATVIVASLLSGCATTTVSLEGETDPSWSPRTSLVAIELPKNATIEERELLPVFQEELTKMGYTVADKSVAVWIIGIATRRDVEFSGFSTKGSALTTSIGNIAVSGGSTAATANYANNVVVNLWLFRAADYRAGKQVTVWEGTETTDLATFHAKPKLVARALVEIIDRNYLNNAQSLNNLDDLKDAVKQ